MLDQSAAAALAAQTQREQRAMALKASFPAQLSQLAMKIIVHSYTMNRKKLIASCEKHNAALAELKQKAHAGIAELQMALDNADDANSLLDVSEKIEAARHDKASLAQQAVAIAAEACELAEAVRDELAPQIAEYSQQVAEKTAEVVKALNEIGCVPEAHPGYQHNMPAVERQFQMLATTWNFDVRQLTMILDQVKGEHVAARDQAIRAHEALNAAKLLLRTVIADAINQ